MWTTQANLETLKTRVEDIEGLGDVNGLCEGQQVLATRISEVGERISVQHVREFMRRILHIESRVGSTGGVIGDTIRHCLIRLRQHAADLDDLRERMRTQEWYHDLSEQESDDEVQRMLARAEGQGTGAENRPSVENRPINRDRCRPRNAAQPRRVPRMMSGRPPRVNSRVDQLRHDFREATVESALTTQNVTQEIR